VVNLSRFDAPPGNLIYSRTFCGTDPMDEGEFEAIEARVKGSLARKVYFTFHGARMYDDALRFMEIAGVR
jgi:hypothetical protein